MYEMNMRNILGSMVENNHSLNSNDIYINQI